MSLRHEYWRMMLIFISAIVIAVVYGTISTLKRRRVTKHASPRLFS
jgi:hypothetical protein